MLPLLQLLWAQLLATAGCSTAATDATTVVGWLTVTTDDCLTTSPTGVADCIADAVTGTADVVVAAAAAVIGTGTAVAAAEIEGAYGTGTPVLIGAGAGTPASIGTGVAGGFMS